MTGATSKSPERSPDAVRIIAGAILVATIVGCGLSLTIALLAVRLDQAGFSARAIGLNTAAGGVATLVGAPLIPWAAHKLGVARLLMASLLLGGAALIGFTLTTDYTAWLLLRFGIGLAVTVMFVLSEFWITTWAPARSGGRAIAIYVTTLAGGLAIGPLLLAWIGTAGNLPFLLAAVLFVGAAGPLMLNAGDAPQLETRSGKNILTFLREAPAPALAAILHGSIEVAGLSLLPVYALRSGLGASEGTLFASLFVLGNCALQLPLGELADRVDRRVLLVAVALTGGAGAAALAVIGSGAPLVFDSLLFLWGGIVGALYPLGLGQLSAAYRGADLASANSAYVMCYALGMLIGPPIIGAGLDAQPAAGFFWSIVGLAALYLLVAGPQLARSRPTG